MKTTLLEPEIVTRKGKPVSVILPIKEYQELLEHAAEQDLNRLSSEIHGLSAPCNHIVLC